MGNGLGSALSKHRGQLPDGSFVQPQKAPEGLVASLEAQMVAKEVLDTMEHDLKLSLTRTDERLLSYRQKQKANAEFLNSLLLHQTFREKLVQFYLDHPDEAMKKVVATLPKELHVEEDHRHMVVLLTDQQTPDQWMLAYNKRDLDTKIAEALPWEPLEDGSLQ